MRIFNLINNIIYYFNLPFMSQSFKFSLEMDAFTFLEYSVFLPYNTF